MKCGLDSKVRAQITRYGMPVHAYEVSQWERLYIRYTQPADMAADQAKRSQRSRERLTLSAMRSRALRVRPRTNTDAVRVCQADLGESHQVA